MMKAETILCRIETARANVERERAAVAHRKERIHKLLGHGVRGAKLYAADRGFLKRHPNSSGLPDKEYLYNCYSEELKVFEERLEGAEAILKECEGMARVKGIDVNGVGLTGEELVSYIADSVEWKADPDNPGVVLGYLHLCDGRVDLIARAAANSGWKKLHDKVSKIVRDSAYKLEYYSKRIVRS